MALGEWVTFAALGDSLTAGFTSPIGLSGPRYYPYTAVLEGLARRGLGEGCGLRVVVVNLGVDGDSTDGMLERFDRSVAPEEPDYVILWAGINDLYAGRGPEAVAGNVAELVGKIKGIGAIPILCAVTPVEGSPHLNERIRELNDLVRSVCEDAGLSYVDLYAATAGPDLRLDPELSDDGVHLSQEGYRVVARTIYEEAVRRALEGLSRSGS